MFPSLPLLRDLPSQTRLPPELAARVHAFTDAALGPESSRPSPAQGIELVQACIAVVEVEAGRLAALGVAFRDPIDPFLRDLRATFASERDVWPSRAAEAAAELRHSLSAVFTASGRSTKLSRSVRAAALESELTDCGPNAIGQAVARVEQVTAAAIDRDLAAIAVSIGRTVVIPPTPLPPLATLSDGRTVAEPTDPDFEPRLPGAQGRPTLPGWALLAAAGGIGVIWLTSDVPTWVRVLMTLGVGLGLLAIRAIARKRRASWVLPGESHGERERWIESRAERFRAALICYARAYLAQRQQDVIAALRPALAHNGACQLSAAHRTEDELIQVRRARAGLQNQVLADLRRLAG